MTTGGPFLVVDDDTVSRLVLASTLRKLGFEVAVAEDVASARTMLDAEEYAAVFTDYEMPDGTGLDLIAHADASGSAVPFVLITGRQLEHWHTGSMTRRASVLDAVEPEANCSLHPATLRELGVAPGEYIKLSTRRGSITVMARADRAVAEKNVFLPFAYVEAAANILTNAALDPYGKIPEFKFSAVKVEKAELLAAE